MRTSLKYLVGWWLIPLVSAVSLAAASDLPLVEAVKAGNRETVIALLKQHVDVNATEGDGATALHWAVHRDDLATTDLLIRAGARTNVANDVGVTPLFLACTNRNGLMVEKLLAAGANPNAALTRGETVLMECARTGNLRAVKALLAKGADVNAKEAQHAQTALMWAAVEAHPDVVGALIELGADIKARSVTYAQTVTGEETQRFGREELNYIIRRGGSTPLLFAARAGDVESIKLLVAAGANVNDTLPDGTSALVEAAFSGHGAAAAVLLEKGADPNAAAVGYTALHTAVLRSDLELVDALLAHHANPNALLTKGTPIRRDSQDLMLPATLIGATPYFLAAKFLELKMMPILVAAGADPRLALPDGTTPLIVAAGMGDRRDPSDERKNQSRRGIYVYDGAVVEPESVVLDGVKTALALGSDINAVNKAGDTALHAAVLLGFDTVVQFLADKGADLNVKNKRGLTPLASLTKGGRGRRGAPANDEYEPSVAKTSTVTLLRKLGGVE
jgi:ankyrin repeat protein